MRRYQAQADVDGLASAIARHLTLPAQSVNPDDVEALASAITRRLTRNASFSHHPNRAESLSSTNAASRVALQVKRHPMALASAVLYRLSSLVPSVLGRPVSLSEINIDAITDQVANRLGKGEATSVSNQDITVTIASAIVSKVRGPMVLIPENQFDKFASTTAFKIAKQIVPNPASSEGLPADTVDASQALRSEEQRIKRGEQAGGKGNKEGAMSR